MYEPFIMVKDPTNHNIYMYEPFVIAKVQTDHDVYEPLVIVTDPTDHNNISLTIIGYCSYINQFRIIFMSYIVEDKEWDISCGYVY
jgi:hypothetical protein